jgi:AAA ATPase domain
MSNKYDIFLDSKEQPDFKNYILFGEEKEIDVLPNFNTINILVGSNNSGKSRFMRTLMKQQKLQGFYKFKYLEEKSKKFNDLLDQLKINWIWQGRTEGTSEIQNFIRTNPNLSLEKLKTEASQIFFQSKSPNFEFNKKMFEVITKIFENGLEVFYLDSVGNSKNPIRANEKAPALLLEADKLNEELSTFFTTKDFESNINYFIPTLRTAHSLFEKNDANTTEKLSKVKKDIFHDTLIKNYELAAFTKTIDNKNKKSVNIFTGLNLYNEIINARNGNKDARNKFYDFEKFVADNFFGGKEIDIVANLHTDKIHVNDNTEDLINISFSNKSGEKEEGKRLYELGDGIQALIILMYSIFMAPNDTMIFIDEPELNLHPGMQRLFLDQITNNKDLTTKNLTYVIATHSNHLLDLTIEKDNISIYSFSKNENNKFLIKNVNAGDNELLRELGVNNSSVFLANSSIWVEGISDRYYLKAFLLAYCNANKDKTMPKEDIDFAFLEYAGSNLVHYDFNNENENSINAYALNNRIFILADKDEGKEDKHNQLEKFAELNEDNLVYETTGEYREVENLLSEDVWKEVLIDFCKKTKTRNSEVKDILLGEIEAKIKKKSLGNFKAEYIGKYLVALNIDELNTVYEGNKSNPKSLKSEYKTLLSKMVLDKTINGELKWEHFSKNKKVVSLIENIYSFITNK